jgi:hypothetical protein
MKTKNKTRHTSGKIQKKSRKNPRKQKKLNSKKLIYIYIYIITEKEKKCK